MMFVYIKLIFDWRIIKLLKKVKWFYDHTCGQTDTHVFLIMCDCYYYKSRTMTRRSGSSVSTVTDCGSEQRIRVPEVRVISVLRNVRTPSGVHPASYPLGTEDYFPAEKGPQSSYLLSSLRNDWSLPLLNLEEEKFTFFLKNTWGR